MELLGIWRTPLRLPVMMRPLVNSPPFRISGTFLTSAITLSERSALLNSGFMNMTVPVKVFPVSASTENSSGWPCLIREESADETVTVRLSSRLSTIRKIGLPAAASLARSPTLTSRRAMTPSIGEVTIALSCRAFVWRNSPPATPSWACAASTRAWAASASEPASSTACRVARPDSFSLSMRSRSRSARVAATPA